MGEESASPASLPSMATRLSAELEFVQCLASPEYLHFLAQMRYFEDPAFMNFLGYLQYWKEPQYARFITYPHCLAFLDLLLKSPEFRKELAMEPFRDFIHQQQAYHWLYNSKFSSTQLQEAKPESPTPPP